jgi:superfamily II DNA/RNA helicase
MSIDSGGLIVTPEPWMPIWADNGIPPDTAAANRELRQPAQAVPGDPFLAEAGGGALTYRTPGQREAVRAVLAADRGETVLAVLPTGSGKTLVATVAARLAKPEVTLYIVPTVALALDIERRIRADYGLDEPIAYHGSLSPQEKVAFRERLRSGEQWIVVTSPEAATTALAPALRALASEGRFRYFVVDEAHIVASWGGAFRPAFQALAGLRRQLEVSSLAARTHFTTVLLTGTLDEYGLQLLERFFSDGGATLVVAQTTRPEPAYWSVPCVDELEKEQLLIEAVRHLPRPLLIYTSLVAGTQSTNTQDVVGWLRKAGFRRYAEVTGQTNSAQRRAVVAALRCDGRIDEDCDVVVASSAFGLGMDIEDVRSVIHACVPESLDRYYQEVGRSGRDGKASVSLLIHSPSDDEVALNLSRRGNIGPEKAWLHWEAMRRGSTGSGSKITVSLTAAHPGIFAPASEANRGWNLHTLTLMELAGMIELHWSPPSLAPPDSATDEEIQELLLAQFETVEVEIKQGDLHEQMFKQRILDARELSGGAATASLALMQTLLSHQDVCFNQTFGNAYRLNRSNGDVLHVDVHCGGCAASRHAHEIPGQHGPSPFPYVSRRQQAPPRLLEGLLRSGRSCSITYFSAASAPWGELEAVLRRLIEAGVQLLVYPFDGQRTVGHIGQLRRSEWLATELLPTWIDRLAPPPMVTAVVLPPACDDYEVRRLLRHRDDLDALIVIHDASQRGPESTKWLLRELISPSVDVSTALARI